MNETRRMFLGRAALGLAAAACHEATHGAAEAPRRPNLLVILTDQQHAGMLSCAGNRHVKTPHMDSLAATGTRFERAYCSDPVCVPSRFSLLSGVMPSRIGMEHNGHQGNPVSEAVLSMLYEEACRIPLLVSWEGVTKQGAVDREHLVSNGLGLIPTLCDYAGVAPPPELKGRSVRPLAEGREPRGWRSSLVVENEHSRLVLWDSFRYGVYDMGERRELLVDLKQDPGEMKNRAAEPACRPQVEAGRRLLLEWYREHGETLNDAYVVKG